MREWGVEGEGVVMILERLATRGLAAAWSPARNLSPRRPEKGEEGLEVG